MTQAKDKKGSILNRILAGLGLLSLFNVVSHYQTTFDFAASLVWLADWWHYLTSYLFLPLPFEMPEWEKDTLVSVLLLSSIGARSKLSELMQDESRDGALPAPFLLVADAIETMRRVALHSYGCLGVLAISAGAVLSVTYVCSLIYRFISVSPDFFNYFTLFLIALALIDLVLMNRKIASQPYLSMAWFGVVAAIILLVPAHLFNSRKSTMKFALALLIIIFGAALVGQFIDPLILDRLEGLPPAPQPVA